MKTRLWLCVLICLVLVGPQSASAQTPTPTLIKYGDLVSGKFTAEHSRFEYTFEAEDGDGVVITMAGAAAFYTTLEDKDGRVVDSSEFSNFSIVGEPPPLVFGILVAGSHTIILEQNDGGGTFPNGIGMPDFIIALDQAPILALDEQISGETKLGESDYYPNLFEHGFYLISLPNSGSYDLHYQLTTTAFLSQLILYDTLQDRTVANLRFDAQYAADEGFAGIVTIPMTAENLYAVILSTTQYMMSDYQSLSFELEIAATPADR